MKHRTFLWFFLPSAALMLAFIAMPIVSVLIQSFYAPHEQVIRTVENCTVFGCTQSTMIDQDATRALREAEPMGRFVGTSIYADRNHLALSDVAQVWASANGFGDLVNRMLNLPFYGALAFTLTYTLWSRRCRSRWGS
jgi:ABC-type sugar transport system permease subunit